MKTRDNENIGGILLTIFGLTIATLAGIPSGQLFFSLIGG